MKCIVCPRDVAHIGKSNRGLTLVAKFQVREFLRFSDFSILPVDRPIKKSEGIKIGDNGAISINQPHYENCWLE